MEKNEADFRTISRLVALILICTLLCTIAYKNFNHQIKKVIGNREEVQAKITLFTKDKVQAGERNVEKLCWLATQKSKKVLQGLESKYKKIIKKSRKYQK